VIRADASKLEGSGHVMRSSAIAEELIDRGLEVVFVGKTAELGWLAKRIKSLGFLAIYESESLFQSNPKIDVLILDTYVVPLSNKFIAKHNWAKVITVVDELTPEYAADLRIHPGMKGSWNKDLETPMLFGPKFIPLRKSIRKVNSKIHKPDNGILKIVVFGGGSDPYGFCDEIASILKNISFAFEANFFTNKKSFAFSDERFLLREIGENLDSEIESADLVFCTASTSSLEVIAREIPVGIACAVDNQELYYKTLPELGVAASIGIRASNGIWKLDLKKIEELILSDDLRLRLVKASADLIDLQGSKRIADAITGLTEM
jgi:spore coat polysaccharide biosynthesis predicted glycosyltransferase SpsG